MSYLPDHNSIVNNSFVSNLYGISLSSANFTNIYSNSFINNTNVAIYIYGTSSNTAVMFNDFLNNNIGGIQVQLSGTGIGNSFNYNFYSDHSNIDGDGNELADTAYTFISSGSDLNPIVNKNNNTLTIKFVNILQPNGGNTYIINALIEWNKSYNTFGYPVTYNLYYSLDNGSNWSSLTTSLSNTSYNWSTLFIPDGYLNKIKITAISGNISISSISASNFTIIGHKITTPTIVYPNGGENVYAIVNIQWIDSTDNYNHSITYTIYYTDDGIIWNTLVTGLLVNYYNWNTNLNLDSNNYKLRVIANDGLGFSSNDTSDDFFIVQNNFFFINLNGTTNNTFIKGFAEININITDLHAGIHTVMYNWDNTSNTTITLSTYPGIYNLTIIGPSNTGNRILYLYANDSIGNVIYTEFLFLVDNLNPEITLFNQLNNS
jgi:hypothetical protein